MTDPMEAAERIVEWADSSEEPPINWPSGQDAITVARAYLATRGEIDRLRVAFKVNVGRWPEPNPELPPELALAIERECAPSVKDGSTTQTPKGIANLADIALQDAMTERDAETFYDDALFARSLAGNGYKIVPLGSASVAPSSGEVPNDRDAPAIDIVARLAEDTAYGDARLFKKHNPLHADAINEINRLRADKVGAYLERNRLVAVLASLFPSGIARTDIPGWLPEWYGCVYIDLPTGQASWHYHDSHAHLFAHLPPYAGKWDGHTTDEKYERLAMLAKTGDASVAPSSDSTALYEAIAHGDDKHRAWLKEALDAFFAGKPVPPPGTSSSEAALREALMIALRECERWDRNMGGDTGASIAHYIRKDFRAALSPSGRGEGE